MSLAELIFVNTRPAHQAEPLNQQLKAQGAEVINFPTLEIKATNTAPTKLICQYLKEYDIAIFASANAVHYSHSYWPSPFPVPTIIAIGPGTEKTLKKYKIHNTTLPKIYNSEGILALPELSSVQNKKIIIFCGSNPKPLLYKVLSQQGASVTLCECYRRTCPKPDKATLNWLSNQKINGIISTSQESLKNLNTLLKDNPNIKKTLLIVISPDMEKFAKAQGWRQVIIAPHASDESIVETLMKQTHC